MRTLKKHLKWMGMLFFALIQSCASEPEEELLIFKCNIHSKGLNAINRTENITLSCSCVNTFQDEIVLPLCADHLIYDSTAVTFHDCWDPDSIVLNSGDSTVFLLNVIPGQFKNLYFISKCRKVRFELEKLYYNFDL